MHRLLTYARNYWKQHFALAAVLLAVIVAFGGYGAAKYRTVHGVKLDTHGQAALAKVTASPELGHGAIVTETPPTAAIEELNQQAAIQAKVVYPTLAAPEPSFEKCLVRNYSSRHGQRPSLWVIHDTESPNVSGRGPPGKQDLRAICSWFNNPNSQASSNYTTDADGNTLLMVNLTDKAWTQAGFNSAAISDEFIGYASQTSWPFAQLHAGEQLAAADLKTYGIPAQHGLVNTQTCQVIRPGIVEHSDLGVCGGGHRDAGSGFPVARFIRDVHRILHPTKASLPAWYVKARTLTPMWAWINWRDHGHPVALRPTQIPARVPAGWWARYARHARAG